MCKPCWELKYCPYGIMVETMPLLRTNETFKFLPDETPEQMYERAKTMLFMAESGSDQALWAMMFFVMYADPEKWEVVGQYDPELVSCRIFGHVCPVFFYGQSVTETKEVRNVSRRIPRGVMFQVTRRDDYRCRMCGEPVPDHLIEFDHIIPHAKGGVTSVENIRLLCRSCNRKKSDSLAELLDPDA
jgi:hypothetical protein